MLAAQPISRTTRPTFRAPAIPDVPRITLVDAIVLGAIGLTILALAAPTTALAVLVVGGLLGAVILVSGMLLASATVEDARHAGMTRAMGTNYSFTR